MLVKTDDKMPGVSSAPRLPNTAMAVLGALSYGRDLSGYDLKKWADASLRYFYWSPALSNIYSELRRLEEHGYVKALPAPDDEPRNKRVFRITAAGRRVLAEWVRQEEPPSLVVKDEALLKVWSGHVIDPDELEELIDAERHRAEAFLEQVRFTARRSTRHVQWPYAVAVEQFCAQWYQARAEAWAELQRAVQAVHRGEAPS